MGSPLQRGLQVKESTLIKKKTAIAKMQALSLLILIFSIIDTGITIPGKHYLIETGDVPDQDNMEVRGPVDHSKVVYSWNNGCRGEEDGTKCDMPCRALNCGHSGGARCFEGECRQGGSHPCDTSGNHSCCCGDCSKPKDHPVQLKYSCSIRAHCYWETVPPHWGGG